MDPPDVLLGGHQGGIILLLQLKLAALVPGEGAGGMPTLLTAIFLPPLLSMRMSVGTS
jgi:hypothetical protein